MFHMPQTCVACKPMYDKVTYVVFGTESQGVKVFKTGLRAYQEVSLPTNPLDATCAKFSDDGRYLAIGSKTAPFLTVFRNNNGTFVQVPTNIDFGNAINAIAWCPDRHQLEIGRYPGLSIPIIVYDNELGRFTTGRSLVTSVETDIAHSQFGGALVIGSATSYSIYKAGVSCDHMYSGTTTGPVNAVACGRYKGADRGLAISYSSGVTSIKALIGSTLYERTSNEMGDVVSAAFTADATRFVIGTGVSLDMYSLDASGDIVKLGGNTVSDIAEVKTRPTDDFIMAAFKTGDAAVKFYKYVNGAFIEQLTIVDSASSLSNRRYADWVTYKPE